MLLEARKKGFQNRFMDLIRRLEKEEKALARFRKAVLSWVRFNGIRLDLNSIKSNIYQSNAGFSAESAHWNGFQSCEPDGKNELSLLSYHDQ